MNREAWLVFLALAVAAAVGLLGVTAWMRNQQVGQAEKALAEARRAAVAQAAHLAEAWKEVEVVRAQAQTLAHEVAAATNSQQRLEAEMRAVLESRDIAISELQGRLTLTILDRILFDSGEAALKPDGRQILDEVAKVLSRFADRQIQVFGHTDNVPIRLKFLSNWELSSARAVAAVRYLNENAGVDARRLTAVACGEFQPIADNSTTEGRARNRRIALVVLPESFVPTDTLATNQVLPVPRVPAAGPVIPPEETPAPPNSETETNAPAPASEPDSTRQN